MNSKYRLLTTFFHKPFVTSSKYCGNGVRFSQFKHRHINLNQVNPNAVINLSWSTCCGCNKGSYNAPMIQNHSVFSRCYVSTPTPDASQGNDQPEKNPSLYQRFKIMYRDYWYVLLPVHLVTSAAWFGSFYYMAISGVDIIALLEYLKVSEKLINPLRNGHATTGYLAISYALYKIATPFRYTVTLGGTTVSINYLKKWGYIKPMPSKEKLKEIYEDKKEILKGKGQTLKDNMMQSLKTTESKRKP